MKQIVLIFICVSLLCLFSKKSFACFQLPHIYNGHEYSDAIEDTYTRSNDSHLIHATFYYNPNLDRISLHVVVFSKHPIFHKE